MVGRVITTTDYSDYEDYLWGQRIADYTDCSDYEDYLWGQRIADYTDYTNFPCLISEPTGS